MESYSALKEEGNPAGCYNMDESWGHHTKWNKTITNTHTLYDSNYVRYLE